LKKKKKKRKKEKEGWMIKLSESPPKTKHGKGRKLQDYQGSPTSVCQDRGNAKTTLSNKQTNKQKKTK
jgi:hypothetical protein